MPIYVHEIPWSRSQRVIQSAGGHVCENYYFKFFSPLLCGHVKKKKKKNTSSFNIYDSHHVLYA
jgi:hypothetical protein